MDFALSAPSRSFIVSTIKSSIDQKFLSLGQSLHALAIKIGFFPETLLCNHLINLYAKCETLGDAHKLFDETPNQNLVSYSILISSNARCGNPSLALYLLSQLQSQALTPNQFVLSSSIAACAKLSSLDLGQQVHSQVITTGFGSDPFVRTTLVDMYCKFGDLDLAISIFKQFQAWDPVLFNSMVSGFVNFGAYEEALLLFREERKIVGFKQTEFSFCSLIKACSNLNENIGKQFHGLILKFGFNHNCFTGTSLVDMYGRLGLIESFEKAFEDILCYDIPLYNAMIGGFSRNGLDEAALDFFGELLLEGFAPNECTFASVLKSCAGLKSYCWGKMIHGVVVKSKFTRGIVINTALIDMYMKCGKPEEGCAIFNAMIDRNVISYNSMISGLGENGLFDEAMNLFAGMKFSNVEFDSSTFVAMMNSCFEHEWAVYGDAIKHGLGSDLMIRNALLSNLFRKGSAEEALEVFKKMRERNVISWTTVVSGLTQMHLHDSAIEVFKTMCSSDTFPNSFTFSSVLKACGNSASVKLGRCIHARTIKHGIMDEFTNSSLVDMYANCGVLEDSKRLFEEIGSEAMVPWNTMITAYAQHGRGQEAMELYAMMQKQNLEPNHVTFMSLLSVCSHCGMLEDGVRIFELMVSKHGITPLMDHYACMIYLFGRAGFLDRAKLFIDAMPCEADASIWTVFLAACKMHGNFELAQLARKKLDGMLCEDSSTLVLVSNTLSDVGNWDDAEMIRKKISEEGAIKEPGLSWVQTAESLS